MGSTRLALSLKFSPKYVDMIVNLIPSTTYLVYSTMASSEKKTEQKDNAAEANDGGLPDDEGLNLEQEEALNKIMAEIQGQDDADAPDPQPVQDVEVENASGGAPSDTEGLDAEQEDALNKIMAEIEGQEDAAPENEATAVDPQPVQDTEVNGLDSEQEDALNKIMAEIEGREDATPENEATAVDPQPDSDTETHDKGHPVEDSDEGLTDNDGLDAEQEDALNKIMAEIEGSAGTEGKDEASQEEVHTPVVAPTASEDPIVAEAAIEETDAKEGLSADQEEALNKIMAEIDAKDEALPQPTEEGLSEEQEAALKNIMAEIEGDGDSGAPGGEEADDAPPSEDDPGKAAEEVAVETVEEAQANTAKKESVPLEESPVLDADVVTPPPVDKPTGRPPSTHDLMSQIQAAAQGPDNELNVSAPSTDGVKTPAPRVAVTDDKNEPAHTTAPLAEVEAKPAPSKSDSGKRSDQKKRAPQKKRSASKKILKVFAWSGAAVAAVLLAAAGTYYWLSNDNAPQTSDAPPAPLAAPLEAASEPSSSDLALEEDLLADASESLGLESAPLEISPESKRLAELSSRIQTRRDDMLAKIREIDELSAYYEQGIEKITAELIGHINTKQITDLDSAREDTAILMGLETIQRRAGYITRLSLPRRQIHAATEELLYLARKSGVLSMIAAKSSGSNLDPFAKQVDEAIERLTRNVAELSLEDGADSKPSIDEVWKQVWAAHVSAPKKEPPATVAMRRNKEIEAEVCKGDFKRVGELSALSNDAADCLAAWEGKDLFLNNLERLSPEAAHSLSQWKGEWLVLNGLKTLSPDTAKQLATWKGKRLSLNGLEKLPRAATQALAKWQGRQLELIGLRRLAAWDNPVVTLYVRSEVRDSLAR